MTLSTTITPSFTNINNLPSLPQTLVELIQACNSGDVDIIAVGEIVARDVTISARILQLANSAFLGTKAAFNDIEQAVIYLGIDTVRNLAVSVSVHEALSTQQGTACMNMPNFWYHALYTALLAKTLAEAAEYDSPAEAYLAGLLHDLGKLLLASNFPEEYPTISHGNPLQLAERERHNLGVSHAEAGALLVRHWNLQESIAKAIESHHHDQESLENALPLTQIVHLANDLGQTLPDSNDSVPSLILSLSPEAIEDCRLQTLQTVEDIAQAMGITVKRPEEIEPTQQENPATQALQEKVGSITQIYGALDNLLKADNRNRICRVMEETLQILFGVSHSFIILPVGSSDQGRIVMSPANPLQPHSLDIPLPEVGSSSVLEKCRSEGSVCFASSQDKASQLSDDDHTLISFLGCEALVVLPIPIQGPARGVLVVSLSHKQCGRLAPDVTSLRLLADHCGARFQLEQIQQQRLADITRKELEAVETITSSIAHEISNPLGIIQSYLAVIERKIAKQTDTTHDIQLISDEIERISTIVRQLENISTLSSPKPVKTTRLDNLLRDVLTFFRESIFQKRKIDVSIKLQPQTRSLPVPTDIIRQVLTILFTNAADSLPNGGKITVNSALLEESTKAIDGDILQLSIRDNGPGIDSTIANSLFNAGITTKSDGHLGLGLSIARKVLIDNSGSITCEPTQEGGALFILTIPIPL